MDGVSLSRLLPGLVYEVPLSLGTFLIGQSAAEEDVTTAMAIVIPLADAAAYSKVTGGSLPLNKDSQDDRPPRQTPSRKKP